MTIQELADIATYMYETAPYGEKVAVLHLFGIKYCNVIKENDYRATEIVRASGLKHSFSVEISNGMKLSRYVCVKEHTLMGITD